MAFFNKKSKEEKKIKQDGAPAVVSNEEKNTSGSASSLYQAIRRPHVTEKGSLLASYNKYVFKVVGTANKIQIRKAIEDTYNVSVVHIATIRLPAKERRVGKFVGQKSGFKKAIVTLKQGDTIDTVVR